MKFDQLISLIKESILSDATEQWYETRDMMYNRIADEFESGKERVEIPRINANRLAKIWLDFGKTGVVRDVKGLYNIIKQFGIALAKLDVSTELLGHTETDPKYGLESAGVHPRQIGYDVDEWDEVEDFYDDPAFYKFSDFLVDENGSWYLSDYGLKPLHNFYHKALITDKPEDMIYAIDKALNVIHARSDLASWFVEGGADTLNKIANQGGYTAEE